MFDVCRVENICCGQGMAMNVLVMLRCEMELASVFSFLDVVLTKSLFFSLTPTLMKMCLRLCVGGMDRIRSLM